MIGYLYILNRWKYNALDFVNVLFGINGKFWFYFIFFYVLGRKGSWGSLNNHIGH